MKWRYHHDLYQILVRGLELEDLRALCGDIGLVYDDLSGERRYGKVSELIASLDDLSRLSELVKAGQRRRSDIDWPAIPATVHELFEPEMILIPAGEFLMGSDPAHDRYARECERPQHTLYLPDYYLAKTLVTNIQYLNFIEETGRPKPKEWEEYGPSDFEYDRPVRGVSWGNAVAYCRWLAEFTGKPYRLPSEAEWEKGARGTDGRIWPWGDQWEHWGASPYGCLDMVCVVSQWTSSLYQDYPYDANDGREDLGAWIEGCRVDRGGQATYRWDMRCAFRDMTAWGIPFGGGFRVAMSADAGSGQPKRTL